MCAFLLILFLTCVSSRDLTAHSPTSPEETFDFEKAIVDFSFDLYRSIVALKNEEDNALLSPISLSNILNLLISGTSEQANAELRRALKYPGTLEEKDINMKYQEIIDSILSHKGGINASLVNRLLLRPDFQIREEFLKTAEKYYKVVIENLDFEKSDQSYDYINSLVKFWTKSRIPSILSNQLDPRTAMVILNVIDFKANWKIPFYPAWSYDGPFYVTGQKTETARFMPQNMRTPYLKINEDGVNCTMISLGYRPSHYKYSMFFVLPDRVGVEGIQELEKSLNGEKLLKIIGKMELLDVGVIIPKMNELGIIDIKEPLKNLGMQTLFNASKLDMGRISKEKGLEVSDCFQAARLEVNEKGTDTFTETELAITSTLPDYRRRQEKFVANRPFLYFIRDNETGAILFLGRKMRPSH